MGEPASTAPRFTRTVIETAGAFRQSTKKNPTRPEKIMTRKPVFASIAAAGAVAMATLGAAGPASAAPITFYAVLNGAAEFPSNASPGSGNAVQSIR